MLYNKVNRVLLDEADEGKGGSGDADAAAKAAAEASRQQVEVLTQSVQLLAKGFEELRGNQTQLTEALAKLADTTPKKVEQAAEVMFGDDVDIEQLSRKDLAKLIEVSITKGVDAKLAKIQEGIAGKVEDLAMRFESKNAGEAVEKVASNHPDFWEWSNEMKALLAENPSLSVNRAYTIVKAENPDKVEKLKSKYEKKTEKPRDFFSLLPTSGRGRADGSGKMTQEQAAEDAFDKIMGELGDVLTSDKKLA